MYLIDTDILSYAIRGDSRVLERFERAGSSPLQISAITLYEIRFGIERSPGRRRLQEAFETIERIPVANKEFFRQVARFMAERTS